MPNYRAMARNAARRYGLNPQVFERQIDAESGFSEDVITGRRASSAGALGIAQIMPQTAKGWGVNPLNPKQALDAAAKNMARYVKQFGSYENALRAYNAGPGAVQASKGYSETNAYVSKILQGRSPSAKGVSPKGGIYRAGYSLTSPEYLKFDPGEASPIQSALNVSLRTPRIGASNPELPGFVKAAPATPTPQPTQTGASLQDVLDEIAQQQVEISTAKGGGRQVRFPGQTFGDGGIPMASGKLDLKELFWQGKNGINVDDGKVVPQGYVEGHQDHVHVAAPKGQIVALGKLAQRMGLHVGENPKFGGVDPVHTEGSFHYSGQAIDVSGDPKKMARYANRVARMRGG